MERLNIIIDIRNVSEITSNVHGQFQSKCERKVYAE